LLSLRLRALSSVLILPIFQGQYRLFSLTFDGMNCNWAGEFPLCLSEPLSVLLVQEF